jgi:hypothetical protein
MAGRKEDRAIMSEFRVIRMACVGALMVLCAAGSGVAEAARPEQPQFTSSGSSGAAGETIKSSLTVEDESGLSRLWSPSKSIVVACNRSTSTGVLEAKGKGSSEVTYKECGVFSTSENTAKQLEEGESLSGCAVKSKGAAEHEIKSKPLKARLVWGKEETAYADEIFARYEPKEGTTLIEIEITGESCLAKGTYKVEGSVLARVLKADQEDVMGVQLAEALNEDGEAKQQVKDYEVEEAGGSKESGTAELKLGGEPAVLESADQVELSRTKNKRALYGVGEPQAGPEKAGETTIAFGDVKVGESKTITETWVARGSWSPRSYEVKYKRGSVSVWTIEDFCVGDDIPNGRTCMDRFTFKPASPVEYEAEYKVGGYWVNPDLLTGKGE